jgi:hypothetical protein
MPQKYQLWAGIRCLVTATCAVPLTSQSNIRLYEATPLSPPNPTEGNYPINKKASRLGGFFKKIPAICA